MLAPPPDCITRVTRYPARSSVVVMSSTRQGKRKRAASVVAGVRSALPRVRLDLVAEGGDEHIKQMRDLISFGGHCGQPELLKPPDFYLSLIGGAFEVLGIDQVFLVLSCGLKLAPQFLDR